MNPIRVPLIFLLTLLLTNIYAKPVLLFVDNTHSSIQFTIPFFGVTEVTGRFDRFSGQFLYDPENIGASRIELSIDASSIDTGLKIRDKDLVNDYLECSKYPIIYFKSKSMKVVGSKQWEVRGDFKLHGVTKEIGITLKVIGDIINGEGVRELGMKMHEIDLNRLDYGIMINSMGGGTVGDTLTATATIRVRDITPYRKDFDQRHLEKALKPTRPFSGKYSGSGLQVSLVNDGENYFIGYSDEEWSWFAQAKMIGPDKYKLMTFNHILELADRGLIYSKEGENDILLTKVP